MMGGYFTDVQAIQPPGGRVWGPVRGTVKEDCKKDEDGLVTALVEYDLGEKGKKTRTALVASEYTAARGGSWFLPEVNSWVLVEFLNGNPDSPVITRCLPRPDEQLPEGIPGEKNQKKGICTKGNTSLWIGDEEKKQSVTLTVGEGLVVRIDAEKKVIQIGDAEGKNTLKMDMDQGVTEIQAEKKIVLSIGGEAAVTIEKSKASLKSQTVTIEGSQSLKLKGQTANLQGSQIQAKADASMKLEAGAMLEVKGAMVKLN